MLLLFLQGVSLALYAAIMPGPFQTYLFVQVLKNGWKRTLPAALTPLITDGPIITLILFVLNKTPLLFLDILRILGGLFILYLAKKILSGLKNISPTVEPGPDMVRKGLINAIILNVLNPNPYIFWGVVAGPILLAAWRESPGMGICFLVGFYGVFVLSLAVMIVLFATAGRLNPKINRLLFIVTSLSLIVFGLYQCIAGLTAVASGHQGM